MAASSGSIVLLDAACCCVRFCERILKALPSIFTADQPMMSAAATIIIQAGEICASHTPKGEVSAPPRLPPRQATRCTFYGVYGMPRPIWTWE